MTFTQPHELERRATYLHDAAHLLTVSSPPVAAFLGSARDRLVEDAEVELLPKEMSALRREICGACGSPLVPGWSCKVSTRPPRGKKKQSKSQGQTDQSNSADKSIVYLCLRCDRETIHKVTKRPARKLKAGSGVETAHGETIATGKGDGGARNSTNANSKQRQKARKGGLLAMLEKNKAATSTSSGLDLMDFAM